MVIKNQLSADTLDFLLTIFHLGIYWGKNANTLPYLIIFKKIKYWVTSYANSAINI